MNSVKFSGLHTIYAPNLSGRDFNQMVSTAKTVANVDTFAVSSEHSVILANTGTGFNDKDALLMWGLAPYRNSDPEFAYHFDSKSAGLPATELPRNLGANEVILSVVNRLTGNG